MVSADQIDQSIAGIANLPPRLVAISLGATSGIGQSALQLFARYALSPRIYSVARPSTAAGHESILASLRKSNPTITYNVITADVSLISEVDKVVDAIREKESKVDILFMSPGFMPFEGRKNTNEGS